MDIILLKEQVLQCQKCELYKTKSHYVFGEGKVDTKVMFIGEAPGANEDATGRPFVGRAGKIFDELLQTAGLKREDVFVANVLKCRPPANRNPRPEEIVACGSYLATQIDIINPKIICPMGNFATEYIFKKYGLKSELTSISRMHGKLFKTQSITGTIKILPLYHPAVATYNIEMKQILVKDIQGLKNECNSNS
jgi:DNA polymerase